MTNELSDVLSSNYMLASLTVRKWSARKKDNEATEELLTIKGATHNAASVIKSLLAGNDRELRDTHAAYDRIRTWFYANSLPWTTQEGQRGDRVVGTQQAMTFLRDFARLKTEAEKARDSFLDVYDLAVANASVSMGGLYNTLNYPNKESVREMFGATLDIMPMPAVTDFDRVTIPGAMAQGLKGKYETRAKKQVECAISDLQTRVIEELGRMASQLGKVAAGEKARLFKSLTGNMQTLANLARSMGPLSADLVVLADRLEAELLQHEVGAFKDNAALANKVATAAATIRDELGGAPAPVAAAQPTQQQQQQQQQPLQGAMTVITEEVQIPEPTVVIQQQQEESDFDFDSVLY
jgi:hypothetical protein